MFQVGNCLEAIEKKFNTEVRRNRIAAWRRKLGAALRGNNSKKARSTLKRHLRPQHNEPITALRVEEADAEVAVGGKHYVVTVGNVLAVLRKHVDLFSTSL